MIASIPPDFWHFLATGQLGTLPLEPSPAEVVELLDQPNNIRILEDVVPNSRLHVLYYMGLELTYIDDLFYQVGVFFRSHINETEAIQVLSRIGVSWYPFVKQASYEDILLQLNKQGISGRRVVFPFRDKFTGETLEVASTRIQLNFTPAPNSLIDSIIHCPSHPGVWTYEKL